VTRQPIRELTQAEQQTLTRTEQQDLTRSRQQLRYIGVDDGEGPQREDCYFTQSRNLPDWAGGDPHTYFREAEAREPATWTAFEEWKVSLPQELSRRQQMALTRDLVQAIAGEKLPITYALHDPRTTDGTAQQPHLHLLISARQHDDHARTAETHFRRYNRAHPERGGAEKTPAMHHMGAVKASRVLVVDILNVHLEHGGYAARLHPDSLQARDIDRPAEVKMLPSDSAKYRRGEITARMRQVLESRTQRAEQRPMEQADAQAYWQRRTIELGIDHDMPMSQKLERIRADRTQAITRTPERIPRHALAHQARTLERSISRLELYSSQIRIERGIEGDYRHDYQRPESGKRSAERLLAQGPNHGLPRDHQAERAVATFARTLEQLSGEQEPQAGAALNVRLFREEERDQGMSW